jgi:hypothetical protein
MTENDRRDDDVPATDVPDEDQGNELPWSGSGPREDDETVTAEDLTELQDEPRPGEPTD